MTNHQAIQQNLRSALRTAFQHAKLDDRNPTIQEIVKSNIPYLDATLEEIHRCAGTASSNVRRAIVDTEIWGHHIPKGTDGMYLQVKQPVVPSSYYDFRRHAAIIPDTCIS